MFRESSEANRWGKYKIVKSIGAGLAVAGALGIGAGVGVALGGVVESSSSAALNSSTETDGAVSAGVELLGASSVAFVIGLSLVTVAEGAEAKSEADVRPRGRVEIDG